MVILMSGGGTAGGVAEVWGWMVRGGGSGARGDAGGAAVVWGWMVRG
ncbi:hypothetical protein [Puia dinghuensis]|nr:hypothetical protein [Puia dinghuensis]